MRSSRAKRTYWAFVLGAAEHRLTEAGNANPSIPGVGRLRPPRTSVNEDWVAALANRFHRDAIVTQRNRPPV